MINLNRLTRMTLMAVALVALGACQKQEGPAERAGKEVDNAAEHVGQQLEKAGESIQESGKARVRIVDRTRSAQTGRSISTSALISQDSAHEQANKKLETPAGESSGS